MIKSLMAITVIFLGFYRVAMVGNAVNLNVTNVLGAALQPHGQEMNVGFYRDGFCNGLKCLVEGIFQRMLTMTLRGLKRDGFISCKIVPIISPRVDYELTHLGHSLLVPIQTIGTWAFFHFTVIKKAQKNLTQNKSFLFTETQNLRVKKIVWKKIA